MDISRDKEGKLGIVGSYSNGFPTKPCSWLACLFLEDIIADRRRSSLEICRGGGKGILIDALSITARRLQLE